MTSHPDPTHAVPLDVDRRTPQTVERLLTAAEVADRLAVPERWVREHTRSGMLPHLQLGRYVRYRWQAVETWLVEQERGGAAWRRHRPAARGGTS